VSRWWLGSVAALVASLVALALAPCGCGHLARAGLLITVPATALGWRALLVARESRFAPRAVMVMAAVVATLVLLKNVGDVLWFGHAPVYG
jgi:hypothetical protein